MIITALAAGFLTFFSAAQLGVRVQEESSRGLGILSGDIDYAKFEVVNLGKKTQHYDFNYVVDVVAGIRSFELRAEIHRSNMEGGLLRSLEPKEKAFEIVLLAPWLQLQDPLLRGNSLQDIAPQGNDGYEANREFNYAYRFTTRTYVGERIQPAEYQDVERTTRIRGFVLHKQLDVDNLYFSLTDKKLNEEYGYYGHLGPPDDQSRGTGATQYDRMMPVDWHFFEIPLNNYYRVPEHFNKLVTQLNPQSKLYRVCRLVQMANEWVLARDGEERLRKEQQMLAYAGEARRGSGGRSSIEAEFLTEKVKQLVATKELERGPYVPPGK